MTIIDYPCGCSIEYTGMLGRRPGNLNTSPAAEYRKMCSTHKAVVKQEVKDIVKRDYDNAVREIDEAPIT